MKPFVTVLSKFYLVTILFLTISLTGCSDSGAIPSNSMEHAVDGAYTATLSQDGQYAVISSIHHGIALWDTQANALKYQWSHQGSDNNLVLVAAISPNNTHVLTADRENFVLWEIATGKAAAFIKVKDSNIRDVAVSNDGRHLLIGKSNGVVVHITTATGRRLEFLGHQEKINSVDLSDNGRFALTGSNDYVAYFWDTESGQVIHRFNHSSRVSKVALDHSRRYAFTADTQKQAQIWDITTGKPVSKLKYTARQNIFSSVRFNSDATKIVTGSPARKVKLWDVATGEQLQSWTVAPRENSRPKSAVVHSVAFINNDKQIISESSSGLAEIWDIN